MPCTLSSSWTRVRLDNDRRPQELHQGHELTMVCHHRSIAGGACEQTTVIFVEFDLNSVVGEHINSIMFLVCCLATGAAAHPRFCCLAVLCINICAELPLAGDDRANVHGMCMCTFWWPPTMMTANDGRRHREKHSHQHLNTVITTTWNLGACWCFCVLTSSPSTLLVRISRIISLIASVLAMYAHIYTCTRKVIETRSRSCKQAMHLLPVMTSWCHHAYVVIRNSPLTK
jgi:hypothetical protein